MATPIGNLQDITLRALEVLRAATVVACEDTRITAKLLSRHDIRAATTPYHEHNAARAIPKLLKLLDEGHLVAAGACVSGFRPSGDPGAGALGATGSDDGVGHLYQSIPICGLSASPFCRTTESSR